mmetsp:Transcript_26342/g.60683  ORF Transcript_26342/g.60683 Transcript_26342/m.60683 type:complete len:216 (+) Transcript_26342:859-1506(+)
MPRLPQPLSHTLLATRMPTRKDDVHGMVHTNLTFFVILSVLFPLPPLSPPERRGDVILPILRVEGAGGRGDRHDGPRRYVVHGTRSHQEHFAQGAEEAVYRGKLREGEDVVPIGRVPGDLVVRRPRAPFFPGQDADLFLRPHAPGDGKIHCRPGGKTIACQWAADARARALLCSPRSILGILTKPAEDVPRRRPRRPAATPPSSASRRTIGTKWS